MNRPIFAAAIAAIPVWAATSMREPVSGLSSFQALPVAPLPAQSAGLAWGSEGRVQFIGGSGGMYGVAVCAPHLRVAYSGSDLNLRDPQTDDIVDRTRQTGFELGSGIALSQIGIGFGEFDLALGADLVRGRARDLDTVSPSRTASWGDVSTQLRWGTVRIEASLRRALMLDADSGTYRDPVVDIGYGSVREDGLQWGLGATVPLHDDREFGLRLGVEKTFSQALSFRVQGSTLYRKSVSSIVADSGERKWIRSGLGLAVGTSLRFRPWLVDRDPTWIQSLIDPLSGGAAARFLYDWELGAMVQLDALTGKSTAGATLGRWF
mgnify:CR=1 FL=1